MTAPRPPRSPLDVSPETLARAVRRGSARALGQRHVKSAAITIRAADGVPLAASFYAPALDDEMAAGTVVISGATGVRRTFYDAFARFLGGQGFRVVTYDYRGIGGSRPDSLRGYAATVREWGERDMEAVLAWAAQRFPGDRRLAVGHSVGGQLLGLAPSAQQLDAVTLVGAQIGSWRQLDWPWSWLYGLVLARVLPSVSRVLGYFPARRLGLGEDLPVGVVEQWAAWFRDPAYFFREAGISREAFARLRVPMLAITVSDDSMAPRQLTDALLNAYAGATIERRVVHPADAGATRLGHFGFFRSQTGLRLWPEVAEWLRRAGTGSGVEGSG